MVFQGSFMVYQGSWLVFMLFQGSFMVFHDFCLVLPKAMCATSPYLVTLRPELALMSNIRANLSSWRSTCPHLQIIASYFDNNVMNDNECKTMRCSINYNFFLPTKYPLQLWKHWECWVDCCCYVSLSWQKVVCSCFVLLAWSCVHKAGSVSPSSSREWVINADLLDRPASPPLSRGIVQRFKYYNGNFHLVPCY